MKEVKYLDHTSEAKFQAFGKTLEDAFARAGLAMNNLMVDVEEVQEKKTHEIEVEAKKLESLLYDFLDELLYMRDVEGTVISRFEDLKIEEKEENFVLTAIAHGDDILNYETITDVKAPTYDEMKIEEREDKWMVQAVVDV